MVMGPPGSPAPLRSACAGLPALPLSPMTILPSTPARMQTSRRLAFRRGYLSIDLEGVGLDVPDVGGCRKKVAGSKALAATIFKPRILRVHPAQAELRRLATKNPGLKRGRLALVMQCWVRLC